MQSKNVLVYPNPTSTTLFIDLEYEQASQIHIIDATGRILKREILVSGSNTIDVSSLPSGTYRLKVISNEGTFYSGFVKLDR